MNIVGVPCSVSSTGIFGEKDKIEFLKKHIYNTEKGFLLMLNLGEKPNEINIASGKTLPNIILENKFDNWEHYKNSLRSNYRRRLKKITKHSDKLEFKRLSCSKFTPQMHQQYLEVYQKSDGKLEKLSLDFFKSLPQEFILTQCSKNNELLGWNIALASNDTYYFFLGGIDYKYNTEYSTYLQLLVHIVKDGIERKAKYIDLGQTAEIPKMRLGGKAKTLFMEAHHSNSFFNALLKKFRKSLEYKVSLENPHPLKSESL
jgi:predicted N-acyltransferase